MNFAVIGISYKETGLDIREKVSFSDSSKIDFMQSAAKMGVNQCMILSTCNRSEVYYFYDDKQQCEQMSDLYQQTFPTVDMNSFLFCKKDEKALQYLYHVAAGLDSLIVGEDQILGQVRDAYEFSCAMGFGGKVFHKVIRDIITCAKEIKTEYKISEHPISVGYAGICELDKVCAIKDKTVFVIGSGKTAELALKYVYEYGARKVYVCNHIKAHTKRLLDEFQEIEIAEYEDRYQLMKQCDIIISATSSPHPVIRAAHFSCEKPVVFLDFASPRDVEAEVARKKNVTLINLDTLQKMVENNKRLRENLAEQCSAKIDDALMHTMDWITKSHIDSTIETLQQRSQQIEDESFAYLERKLELSGREKKIIRKVFHASLQRLLREPIQELKQLDTGEQDEYKKMIRKLFQI